MSWMLIADRAQVKKCDEARRYGSCKCRSGKRGKYYNPCQRLEKIRQSAMNLDQGSPAEMTIEEIQDWASHQTCHASRTSRSCNHKGCVIGERINDWLEIEKMPLPKAA
jgi:hypothetical protein